MRQPVNLNIARQKRLEAQLLQSQKMEAVRRLAEGLAHDFNNLLAVIVGYSNLVLRKLDDNSPLHGQVSEIQAAGERATHLTNQLLALSRKQSLHPEILNPNTVVSNIYQALRKLLGDDMEISLQLGHALGEVYADPVQLAQILVNLAGNARDAMPKGGNFAIETRNCELDENFAPLVGVPPGHYVVIALSDTGCGMDEATAARVFEPFFTTREVNKGSGLGLAVTLGVVQQSGGTVTVCSEPGAGTTFKIYLPRFETSHDK
jgi:two-component system, cell cycle sensor histidine kinase and response regulator CckA